MRLRGAVRFDKILSSKDSSFVPSNEEKDGGGFSIFNEEKTSDEE